MTNELKNYLEALEALHSQRNGISSKSMAKELAKAQEMGSVPEIMAECIIGIGKMLEKQSPKRKTRTTKPSESTEKVS